MVECVYRNGTNKMVILKCIGAKHFYLEKVIMPAELHCFEAPEDGQLEIWKMSGQGHMLHIRADVAEYAIQHESAANAALACWLQYACFTQINDQANAVNSSESSFAATQIKIWYPNKNKKPK